MMSRPILYPGWLDEEETLIIDEYAKKKCDSYQPNWVQSWIDCDPAGVVVSVEPLENDRSLADFIQQQILIDLAHCYFRKAEISVSTRCGTLYTWRYRLEDQTEWVPPAYDLSCYDDDHEHPVAVCLFYSYKDATIEGADLRLPSAATEIERTETGRVVVMNGGLEHVHTACRGSGEMRMVAVALYLNPPEKSWGSWWTARW